MSERIQVAVVDDHPLFRDSVALLIKGAPEMDVVAVGSSAADAIRIAHERGPDIMLLDVNMPGCGVNAARSICQQQPGAKPIMLTVSENTDHLIAALDGGARGYILKDVTGTDLLQAIRSVQGGGTYVTPSLAVQMLGRLRQLVASDTSKGSVGDLTGREEQVLELAARGRSNKEIARALTLSEKTIKQYMSNILQKLQVRNRVEATLLYRKLQ